MPLSASTEPFEPKLSIGRPVFASMAQRCASPVGRKMRPLLPSDQYATPRELKPVFAGRSRRHASGSNVHSAFPVAASIAEAWLIDVLM